MMKNICRDWFSLLISSLLAGTAFALLVLVASGRSRPLGLAKSAKLPFSNGHARSENLNLFGNGYFPALHGYFFLDEHDRLHVYRYLPTIRDPKSQKLEIQPEDNELKSEWNGEPYYHETYVLDGGEWVPKMWGTADTRGRRVFSNAPERYLKFASCDQNDALDLHREDLKKASWRQSKVKDVYKFGNYAALVYSLNPAILTGPPSGYKPDQRPVWLDLLKKTGKTWELPGGTQSVSVGNYCGKVILTATRSGHTRPVLLLFFEDGDYNVAYSYIAD